MKLISKWVIYFQDLNLKIKNSSNILDGTGLVKRSKIISVHSLAIKLNEDNETESLHQKRGNTLRGDFKTIKTAQMLESPRISDHNSMFSENDFSKYDHNNTG